MESQGDRTRAVEARHALAGADSFAFIAGEDRRPLLVLRECLTCTGTDDALMTRKADNERTMLMSRWFHCVKLPPDVLADDHPFHSLFEGRSPGHLFVARWDGSGRTDLNGQQSRTELWEKMEALLGSEYEKKAEPTLKQLLGILDGFDRIDGEISAVKGQIDDAIEDDGADSPKLSKLQAKLADLEQSKTQTRAQALKISELKLRQVKDAARKSAGIETPDQKKT